MTNAEKFKTAPDRSNAYREYIRKHGWVVGEFCWLELEAEEEELLPCPFCGGEAKIASAIHDGTEYHWVECTICHGRSLGVHHKESAIAAWNRRAK